MDVASESEGCAPPSEFLPHIKEMLPRNHYSPGYEGYLLPSSSVVISVAANPSDPSPSLEWSLLTTSPSGKTIKYTISPSVYSAVQPRPPYASTTYHVPGDNNAPLLSGPDPLCTLAYFVLAGVSSDALSSETLTALSEEAVARCHAGVPTYLIPDYVAGRVSAPFVWLLLMLDGIEKHLSRAAQTQAQEEHSGERAALRALNVLVCVESLQARMIELGVNVLNARGFETAFLWVQDNDEQALMNAASGVHGLRKVVVPR